jgi:hypothetical protein
MLSSEEVVPNTEIDVIPNAELQSPDATPRHNSTSPWDSTYCHYKGYWYHDTSYDLMAYADCDVMAAAGYPITMMHMMMPMPPCVNESQMEMQPQVVKPRNGNVSWCEAFNVSSRSYTASATGSHVKPAKKQDLKKLNRAAAVPLGDATTLMIRGIPCTFSQEALIGFIENAGLIGKYNFFYLPRSNNRSSNLGYCLINFVDQESAELCTAAFKGVRLDPAQSMKTCTISPADIQGLANLWKHSKGSVVSLGKPLDSGKPWFHWAYVPQDWREAPQSKTCGIARS